MHASARTAPQQTPAVIMNWVQLHVVTGTVCTSQNKSFGQHPKFPNSRLYATADASKVDLRLQLACTLNHSTMLMIHLHRSRCAILLITSLPYGQPVFLSLSSRRSANLRGVLKGILSYPCKASAHNLRFVRARTILQTWVLQMLSIMACTGFVHVRRYFQQDTVRPLRHVYSFPRCRSSHVGYST